MAGILFTRRLAGTWATDLIRLDLETGAWKPFASVPTAGDHSSWPSPTRDEIVFVSDRDGSDDIFLVDLADGAPRNLTRSPHVDEAAPLWSPDGEKLVILQMPPTEAGSRPPAEEHRLLVIDREGRTHFETEGMMADWMPAWPEAETR
jgi:Tol biopolymer transport system component